MLRLIEVASQSETFSKRVWENHESKIIAWMAQPGHYRAVFSIDRPPLLAVMPRCINSLFVEPRNLLLVEAEEPGGVVVEDVALLLLI